MLEYAEYIPSPNCNERPEGIEIDMIVVHSISLPEGEYGNDNVIKLFLNQLKSKDVKNLKELQDLKEIKFSAHLYIRRDGTIIQFVPFHLRAWHAGASEFQGRTNCNDFSIGIELEGTDKSIYTDIQYEKLNEIINNLKKRYPNITDDKIVGHSDIAPGRKKDPGALFDWSKVKQIIGSIS